MAINLYSAVAFQVVCTTNPGEFLDAYLEWYGGTQVARERE